LPLVAEPSGDPLGSSVAVAGIASCVY
jgi:hypothetical protein